MSLSSITLRALFPVKQFQAPVTISEKEQFSQLVSIPFLQIHPVGHSMLVISENQVMTHLLSFILVYCPWN